MRILTVFLLVCSIVFGNADGSLPKLTARVVDNAHILSSQTKQNLELILQNEEHNSSNQIVVATVASLGGYEIEEFSISLARKWALGQKDKNNGVLLLIAPNERKVRIEVGYGLEGALSDKISHEIIEYTMLPYFKNGDFDTGVVKGVNNIISAIKGEYEPTNNSSEQEFVSQLPFLFTLFGFGSLVLSQKLRSKTLRSLGLSSFLSAFSLPLTLSLFGLSSFAPYIIFLILFIAIFLLTKNMKMVQHARGDDFGYIGGMGGSDFGSGGFSGGFGGGFGGGGGSFGGGGASGGW